MSVPPDQMTADVNADGSLNSTGYGYYNPNNRELYDNVAGAIGEESMLEQMGGDWRDDAAYANWNQGAYDQSLVDSGVTLPDGSPSNPAAIGYTGGTASEINAAGVDYVNNRAGAVSAPAATPDPAAATVPGLLTADQPYDAADITRNQFPFTGIEGDAATDMTNLLASDSPYMESARTAGLQFANERGLLNSSMAGQASEKAAIDASMPIVQMQANERSQARQNLWQSGEAELARSHDVVMNNLDADNRARLIDLEQGWNAIIRSNENMTNFYTQGIESLGDILSSDLTPEQFDNAINEFLGYTDLNGAHHPGTLETGLDFINNVNQVDTNSFFSPGESPVAPGGSPAPAPTAPTTGGLIDPTNPTVNPYADTQRATDQAVNAGADAMDYSPYQGMDPRAVELAARYVSRNFASQNPDPRYDSMWDDPAAVVDMFNTDVDFRTAVFDAAQEYAHFDDRNYQSMNDYYDQFLSSQWNNAPRSAFSSIGENAARYI